MVVETACDWRGRFYYDLSLITVHPSYLSYNAGVLDGTVLRCIKKPFIIDCVEQSYAGQNTLLLFENLRGTDYVYTSQKFQNSAELQNKQK